MSDFFFLLFDFLYVPDFLQKPQLAFIIGTKVLF